ncbi:helix-turn-helix domain-containing protein [Pseudochryseolinea flava]|uniref:AraC family transcriptional regulator n=1 Tax=Pseudochryseolinea flava TaxID=2059302 RepID=A0A364Y7P4_9BACT|nr:AraC family transcriptional regulator [Pseudochryseolinea flava]RAW02923.1 AraC family transcriptional regulator [Pseudochryseolinea flava]
MITDVISLGAYTVLVEQSNAKKPKLVTCNFRSDAIGFAFYGSANVQLKVTAGDAKYSFENTTGKAISFFANSKVSFTHAIASDRRLQCITIFIERKDIAFLHAHERNVFHDLLLNLVETESDFLGGPQLRMPPTMQQAVQKILSSTYQGDMRVMFIKSQITELLAHYFYMLSTSTQEKINHRNNDKVLQARNIMIDHIDAPPSLAELAKLVGINQQKLKTDFKAFYGVPIFKYLQHERLDKAFSLIQNNHVNVQEAASAVGYESLSSFSNAFTKKFGMRPSAVRQ